LPSFGEKLKQEREKRKITLEQISASTKIGTRMLQALEEDKFNQLPGGIFNKGFVRAYSRVVGLDEDQAVADYLEASGDAPPPRTEISVREEGERNSNIEERVREENLRRMEASADDSRRPLPWGLFAAILLVIALALSLWSRHQREHNRQVLRPAASTTSQALPGTSPGTLPEASPVAASGGANAGRGASSPASPAPSGKSTDAAAPSSAAPGSGEFTVVIQAREDSWVSITADGKPALSELLTAGSERSLRGRKEIVVKAGNAGALDFRLNGRKLETGGDYGEVKTVTFGPDGILANASTPPSTP
jgi:cytoskeletal protein RodZ